MSQRNVERVIGLLATDEGFRHRFTTDPRTAMDLIAEQGIELTPGEQDALLCLSPRLLDRFARGIDPRIQKCDLKGHCS